MRLFLGKENEGNIIKKLNLLIENYNYIVAKSKSRIEYVDLRF